MWATSVLLLSSFQSFLLSLFQSTPSPIFKVNDPSMLSKSLNFYLPPRPCYPVSPFFFKHYLSAQGIYGFSLSKFMNQHPYKIRTDDICSVWLGNWALLIWSTSPALHCTAFNDVIYPSLKLNSLVTADSFLCHLFLISVPNQ